MVWSNPLKCVICIYMLWGILGPSVLAGVGVMILLIPINGVMASYQRKLQVIYAKSIPFIINELIVSMFNQ